ncbi:hypothetical protein CAEBREN_07490 [Caenorhabditis brenneri]|uniref:Uncharacterized protein n=1 Tax=Caenorhabditis brenneri TaxID=135651 RepID=G0PJ52_CAEBE|nr:hypothetical protein CAEBREN_07490 [Caenorhabditis brenneri]
MKTILEIRLVCRTGKFGHPPSVRRPPRPFPVRRRPFAVRSPSASETGGMVFFRKFLPSIFLFRTISRTQLIIYSPKKFQISAIIYQKP